MNWPQSSYSATTAGGMNNNNSLFGSNNNGASGIGGGSGYGTPGQGQQQQQPQQQQQLQQQVGYNNQQQTGYNTPSSLYGGAGGFQSTGPTALQQHTFSTSSPQQQQQQQHGQGGQGMSSSMMGYSSPFGNSGNQFGSSAGGYGGPSQNTHQQMMAGSNNGLYGQFNQQQQQQSHPQGHLQQQNNATGAYGSPQVGPGALPGATAGNGTPAAVGRYLPGYLTASSLSGSPRQSTSTSNHDGRLSPEQSHRDTGASFGAGSSRLFASSTSSAGTAGKESPSRSPKQSLFSSSAYGSSRSLALTPGTSSRTRRTSNNNLVRSSQDDYMEEDAPPVDTLDEFDNDAGIPYVSSPPPQQPAPLTAGSASPSKRPLQLNGTSSNSSSYPSASAQNGFVSSSSNGGYKLIVFGFPANLQSTVMKEFAAIAPLLYNSITDPNPSSSSVSMSIPPTGSNWFTIAYDTEWAAARALRKNGDIIADSAMIGVKWADGDSNNGSNGGAFSDVVSSSQQQQQSQQTLPRSSTASNLGTPATVLPASQAFLPKPNSNGAAMRKSATMNKINDMGKLDPSIFKQPDATQQKQGGGVVGTLTNLIFGF